MMGRELLTVVRGFQGFLLGFAISLGIEEGRLGGDCHWDGPVDFFEEVVDDRCRRLPGFLSAGGFAPNFSAVAVTLHIFIAVITEQTIILPTIHLSLLLILCSYPSFQPTSFKHRLASADNSLG